ncbi:MAG: tryptophan synthase subunit alpha [Flavobacteriales bacterium]|nr:tryptophan synthase subunit alpha [Flavobacteriales bacterium]
MSNIKIMGHLVIGYPTLEKSLETAFTYIENGIEILELQIPFSDPTADGEVITLANKTAIQNEVSLEDSLLFIKRIKEKFPTQEIYVMTYLNKIITQNWESVEQRFVDLGITQLIIPDLPFDSPETAELEKNGRIKIVPVIGVNITENRLEKLLEKNHTFIYIMSGFKITGSAFDMHTQMKELIYKIRQKSNAEIGIGFGVDSHSDAEQIASIADVVIVGSSLIKAEKNGKLTEKINEIKGN